MIKSTTNTQEPPRLPRPEEHHHHQQQQQQHQSTSQQPTHQVTAVIAGTGQPPTASATTESASAHTAMDALKTAFLPNLSMDPNVIMHYCPMCHQQFERPQHLAEHMQLCHGLTLNAQGAITTLEQQQQQQHQQLKLSYPCANCDDKFVNAQELDDHHRLVHQATGFLARCLICSIYGVNSATQNPNEYKCLHCGSVCTAAMLAAGQQSFMEQQEAVTPDELPAIAPRDMRLTPEEQHHQQLQQQQQEQQQQQHHQQQVQHQQQQQDPQDELNDAAGQVALKVPPLTVKLNKNGNGAAVTHPIVIIKEEPLSLSDSGDVVQSVPVYAIQANPSVVNSPQQQQQQQQVSTGPTTSSTQTSAADLAPKFRHKCPDCPKTFKTPGTLSMHRKIHTGEADATPKERPYTCAYCDKSFTQSNTLKQHIRIHTGEKPFHCGFCEKSFSVKDYLTKHIRTHTGEKPYSCPICDKRFTQRSALTVHMTKLHPL